jgi:division/cell wall cluster transcriptional repressor MraZ
MPTTDITLPNFHGEFSYGVDQGRRVMIPAFWRPKDRKVIFTAILWPIKAEEYLLVLPPDRWQAVLDKMKTGKLTDQRAAKLERTIAATSAPMLLDTVGRFCLPEKLAVTAKIGKEALFVGRLYQFEIWNPKRYEASLAADKEEASGFAQELGI